MSQKLNRKSLKRNDLADTVQKTVGYVSEHRRGATEAIAIAAGVAVLVGGFFLYKAWQERVAGQALSQALAVLDTPLVGEPSVVPGAKTFPNAAERKAESEKLLKQAASHGSTSSGRAAAVILAANGTEKPEESLDAFEKAARQGRSEAAAAAEIDAAKLLAAQGKPTEAIERLKRAIDSPKSAAPKDALLFTLAQIYEQTGSQSDARATYQRLINDYPTSAYRSEARQKVPVS